MSTRVYSSAGLSVCFRDDGRWLLQSYCLLNRALKVEGGCEDGKGLEAANSSYDVSSSSGSIYSSLAPVSCNSPRTSWSSAGKDIGLDFGELSCRLPVLFYGERPWFARRRRDLRCIDRTVILDDRKLFGDATGNDTTKLSRGPAVNRGKTKRRRDDGRIEWRHNVMPDCPITTQRTKLNIYRGLWADNVDQKGALGSCQRDRMDRTNSTPIKIGL
ncbi:hypothetical protein KCU60_g19, partial [Aureobasidium melanogenum]